MGRGVILCGQVFNSVEIKPEMTGHYLAEFSCSYRPVKHGRPGVRIIPSSHAWHSSDSGSCRSVRRTVSTLPIPLQFPA